MTWVFALIILIRLSDDFKGGALCTPFPSSKDTGLTSNSIALEKKVHQP